MLLLNKNPKFNKGINRILKMICTLEKSSTETIASFL